MGGGAIAAAFLSDLALTESGRGVAIGSRRIETRDRFAERFELPNRHGSYEALVADPEVDIVYVATPSLASFRRLRLALERASRCSSKSRSR